MRYGYRRVQVLLRREGWVVNHKRTYRVYRELGLQLRAKTPKRRVRAKLREDRCPASRPNQTWAMDFVHDQLAMGKKIRVLTVVDIFSKFSPVIDPRFSYRGEDVVATLEQVCAPSGISRHDPRRSGLGIYLPRSGPVGLCPRRHAGLQPTRKADGQCVHRSLQRSPARGVSWTPDLGPLAKV